MGSLLCGITDILRHHYKVRDSITSLSKGQLFSILTHIN